MNLPTACTRTWLKQASNSVPIEIARVTKGAEVVQLRQLCDLTQRELADHLGTHETTVSKLERGTAVIDTRWSSHLTLLFAWLTKRRSAI